MDWNRKHVSRHCERDSPKQYNSHLHLERGWGRGYVSCSLIACVMILLTSCSISYSFTGGSVNYDLTKTIHIADFPDRTSFYSPTASIFNQALRKRFIEQTRLKDVNSNADIEMEGEISNVDLANLAVKGDAFSSQARLTVTVRIQYVNNKEAGKNVEQSFSAFQEFPTSQSINDVQDDLIRKIIDELVDMIYNATIANW